MSRAERTKPPFHLRWFLFTKLGTATWDLHVRRERQLRYLAPVRFWLISEFPMFFRRTRHQATKAIWWVRHRTTDRNHVVDSGLKPGWLNSRELMYHTAFEIMRREVQRRYLNKSTLLEKDQSPYQRDEVTLRHYAKEFSNPQINELADLYLWWVYEFPRRVDPWSASTNSAPLVVKKVKQKTKRWYGKFFVPTLFEKYSDDPLYTVPGPEVDHMRLAVDNLYNSQLDENFKKLASLSLMI